MESFLRGNFCKFQSFLQISYKFRFRRLFKIKLSSNDSEEQWEEIIPRGGKTLDIRVVAHSTVYHEDSNSLIVYGGIVAGVARFSKLSDRMFAFNLNELHWTEILYPRSKENYIPRERAFHSTNIVGNYLVVFGEWLEISNKICNKIEKLNFYRRLLSPTQQSGNLLR